MKHPASFLSIALVSFGLMVGCAGEVVGPATVLDFGEVYTRAVAIQDTVPLVSEGRKATLTSVAWTGGQAFRVTTPLPLEMDAGAPYAIGLAFQPPVDGFQTWDDTAVFTFSLGDASATVEVSVTGVFTNGDVDGDGHVDVQYACDGCDDCDDLDATVYPGAEEICDGKDNTCDGTAGALEVDADGDGYMLCDGDCNDNNHAQNPGLTENCDGVDTDCDGSLSAAELDGDSDGVTECAGDCAPTVASVHPGAIEICDGYDTDCNAGGVTPADEVDVDGDTYRPCSGDCDDSNAGANPGRPQELCDGFDTNCDTITLVDEVDVDADGWFPCNGDCDDGDPLRFPTNPEVCDFIDNNCDGVVPANEVDGDGDSSPDCVDCDDGNADVYPGAPRICDAVDDNDCDGTLDPNEGDGDADLFSPCEGDCDDSDININPGAPEVCDGLDNDCSGQPLGSELMDSDGDSVLDCADADCPIWVDGAYTGGSSVGTVAAPFVTISAAIAAAVSNATCPAVHVQPGTYVGQVDFGASDLRLVAERGASQTTLDGAGVGPVVTIAGGQTASSLLWGFTVTGGISALTGPATGHGGGIYIDAAHPVLEANVITGNVARFHGGGIYAAASDVDLLDNTISGNTSDRDGGGAYIKGNAGLIEGNTFHGNTAEDDAGGLFLGETSTTEVAQNVFSENTATGANDNVGNGWGGGLLNHLDSATDVHNNLFVANVAEEAGGIFVYSSAPTVTNNTFFDNHGTTGEAGGLRVWQGTYRNNIVASGTGWGARILGTAGTTWEYNNVVGWSSGLYFDDPQNAGDGDQTGTDGNLAVAPGFLAASADGQVANDYLTLVTGSLCVDAGDPAAASNDVNGSRNDMGAYGGPEGGW